MLHPLSHPRSQFSGTAKARVRRGGIQGQGSAVPSLTQRCRRRLRVEELECRTLPATVPGFSPPQILQAYGVSQLNLTKPGLGETIAVVEAYLQPNAQADLNKFNSQFGLTPLTLQIVNDGATRSDPTGGW